MSDQLLVLQSRLRPQLALLPPCRVRNPWPVFLLEWRTPSHPYSFHVESLEYWCECQVGWIPTLLRSQLILLGGGCPRVPVLMWGRRAEESKERFLGLSGSESSALLFREQYGIAWGQEPWAVKSCCCCMGTGPMGSQSCCCKHELRVGLNLRHGYVSYLFTRQQKKLKWYQCR